VMVTKNINGEYDAKVGGKRPSPLLLSALHLMALSCQRETYLVWLPSRFRVVEARTGGNLHVVDGRGTAQVDAA
jgi:hypothetical protein